MANSSSDEPKRVKSLRLWPGVTIVILQWLLWLFLQDIMPEALAIGVFSGIIGWLAIIIWWAFFSRAPVFERWSAPLLMIVMIILTFFFLDESISTAMMGMMFPVYVTPFLSLMFVIWAVVSPYLKGSVRRITMVASIILSCAIWIFIKTDGMTGDADQDLAWRWAETSEERFLTQFDDNIFVIPKNAILDTTLGEWPGFRGKDRDAIIRDVVINTDWTTAPPTEMWRRPIGPGISSFAVRGQLVYTQEQRGQKEMVTCYDMHTGKLVWKHSDHERFWDSHAGAGPRGTPTVIGDRLYSLGATGILNVLNAADGSVIWSRNTVSDTKVKIPEWGISSSPLVVDSIVIVAAVGKLAAYHINSSELLWVGPEGAESYSSPHLAEIDGVNQVLFMEGGGVISVSPNNGEKLWYYEWPPGVRIVQPALTENGDLLIGGGDLNGIRRISVRKGAEGWIIEERWTSKKLKPYYNDFVVHNGHAYGFNGSRIVCLDVENGERKWRGNSYGYGQLILLEDQDMLIIISEKGELALARATPEKFEELSRIPAIEGKTWNHPVFVNDVLLVRNSQEMVAFKL
jgi:outer membrane protein assembly factor BamB